MIASLTVTSSRSASSLLTNALENGIEASDGRFWLVSIVSWLLIALTGVWSTDFLNKAMMHFGTNEVVPVYYTTFTIASVAAGGLVYSEFSCLIDPVNNELDTVHTLLFVFGCLFLFLGVYLVSSGRGDAKKGFEGGTRLIDGEMRSQSHEAEMRSPEHLARAAGTSVGRFPEPDLPWGGLGFTFDNDSQILAGRTEGLTINNMAMSSLNKGGTFNVAMTVASELREESRIRRTSKGNVFRSRSPSPTPGQNRPGSAELGSGAGVGVFFGSGRQSPAVGSPGLNSPMGGLGSGLGSGLSSPMGSPMGSPGLSSPGLSRVGSAELGGSSSGGVGSVGSSSSGAGAGVGGAGAGAGGVGSSGAGVGGGGSGGGVGSGGVGSSGGAGQQARAVTGEVTGEMGDTREMAPALLEGRQMEIAPMDVEIGVEVGAKGSDAPANGGAGGSGCGSGSGASGVSPNGVSSNGVLSNGVLSNGVLSNGVSPNGHHPAVGGGGSGGGGEAVAVAAAAVAASEIEEVAEMAAEIQPAPADESTSIT